VYEVGVGGGVGVGWGVPALAILVPGAAVRFSASFFARHLAWLLAPPLIRLIFSLKLLVRTSVRGGPILSPSPFFQAIGFFF
jgi:bacteriorhodopsin